MALSVGGLNHVSRVVSDCQASAAFYRDVLGFTLVKRPGAFNFKGAWLWGHSLGIHLIEGNPPKRSSSINPKSEHISFQASCSLLEVEECLEKYGIPYVKQKVLEGGIEVQQVFFHDPDNNMIEICNCDCLPIIPLAGGNLSCTAAEEPLRVSKKQAVAVAVAPAASDTDSCLSMQDSGDEELGRFDAAALAVMS